MAIPEEFKQLGATEIPDEFKQLGAMPIVATQEPESGTGEALARGALHGATMGFDDRAEAGARRLGGALGISDETDYDTLLKDIRDRNRKVAAEHPYVNFAGEMGGGIGSILLGGGLLGAGAKAAGLGAEAATAANALGLGGKAVGTFGGTLRGGATLGAASGLGNTEDLTNIPKATEDVIEGAGSGMLLGGVLHGTGAGIKKGLNTLVSKVPGSKEFIDSAKRQYSGGSWNTSTTEQELKDTVAGKLLPKIRAFEESVNNKYNQLLDNTDITLSPSEIEKMSPEMQKVLNPLMESETYQGKVDPYKGQPGWKESIPTDTTIKARLLDNSKKEIQNAMNGIDSSTPEGRQQFTKLKDIKNELVDFMNNKNASLADINRQYSDIETLRTNLGDISQNLNPVREPGQMPQEGAEYANIKSEKKDYIDTVKSLTKEFADQGAGNSTKDLALKDARRMASAVERENPTEGLDPSDKIFEELAHKAKELDLVKTGSKPSEFGTGLFHTGLSAKTAPVLAGRIAGEAGKLLPKVVVDQLSKAISSQTPEAATFVKKLSISDNPDAQKAGKMLTQIIGNPGADSRRAAMFALGQQPWFRNAVHRFSTGEESGQ